MHRESPRASGFEIAVVPASILVGALASLIAARSVVCFNPLVLLGSLCFLAATALFLALGWGFTVPQVVGYEVLAGFGLGAGWAAELVYPRIALRGQELCTLLAYTRMIRQTTS